MTQSLSLERRTLLRAAALGGLGLRLEGLFPAWAQPVSRGIARPLPVLSGTDLALTIQRVTHGVDGKAAAAVGINGTVPAPLLRLKEGQRIRIAVRNALGEDSSIHWHGLLVPFEMDGVPGISFPGIPAGGTFVYEFPVVQSGTYWYHSHSGYQEQDGLYGPIVIDPAGSDPIVFDREHVIMLADHSPMGGAAIFRKLKQMGGGYFNMQRLTLSGLLAGRDFPAEERREWAKMRMDPADILDVTGSTYTFTVNGYGPFDNWTGLFNPGERVRLRIINAAAQTNFNVRIPGLPMTVVAADGQNVRPVMVDEFQIGVAETFDVVVTPGDRAYSFVSEAIDRSGLGRATLAPREGMSAPVPPLRPRPLATMRDMGMGSMHGGGSHRTNPATVRGVDPSAEQNASRNLWKATGWNASSEKETGPASAEAGGMDHAQHGAAGAAGHSMSDGSMRMRDPANAPQVRMGPGVQSLSPMPEDRSGEPPQGLEGLGHRVLVYRDLMALEPNPDVRAPSRAMEVHLTGNMERYMWSFDGVKLSDPAEPLPFRHGERVRVTLVNDTMMPHPIHLHGHFFELVTGHGAYAPRKHTVNVPPGGKMTFDVTTDAAGDWAFHCHNFYHMTAGMMRVVTVRANEDGRNVAR